MSQQQQQQQSRTPTAEQIYQQFNKNELDSRQCFEIIYNECHQVSVKLAQEKAKNAELIEQLNQFTKQKNTGPSPKAKTGKK